MVGAPARGRFLGLDQVIRLEGQIVFELPGKPHGHGAVFAEDIPFLVIKKFAVRVYALEKFSFLKRIGHRPSLAEPPVVRALVLNPAELQPGINPDAQEVCDAADVDEDCDGLADDADASATGHFHRSPSFPCGLASSSTRSCFLYSSPERLKRYV